jgi:hypothetical protein
LGFRSAALLQKHFEEHGAEFGVLSAAGHILTYFKPDPRVHGKSTNREYFRAECRR